jgi:cytochrome c oxidase subunit 1
VTGLFIGSIFTPWAIPIGAVPVAVALTGWFWPKGAAPQLRPARAAHVSAVRP